MHKLFREALDDAKGVSEFIIAVIVDIRGFSAFSHSQESPDTAMFVKRVYIKLIDSYFPFASFYKSTGDGLLLTIPFDENNLEEVAQNVITSCISCHSDFANLCDGDPMINFKVPDRIGIGVARGTACCLVSGDKIIDYSGRLLNLTSRLNDLARPSGIVIDGAFGIGLLTDEQQAIFQEMDVYLKGIYEDESIKIYFTPEFTTISDYNKQPIAEKKWRTLIDIKPLKELLNLYTFRYELESQPITSDEIKVEVRHDKVINGEVFEQYYSCFDSKDFKYKLIRGKPYIVVNFPKICERLAELGVKEDMNITITIAYVEK